MDVCEELRVLELPGWDTCDRVRREIETAGQLEIPINYIEEHYHTYERLPSGCSLDNFSLTVDASRENTEVKDTMRSKHE